MGKIKSLFIAIGITLIGIAIFFLVPILLAIVAFILSCMGIVTCVAVVYILVDDERNATAIVHKEEDT